MIGEKFQISFKVFEKFVDESGTIDGKWLSIEDLPGIFDTSLSKDIKGARYSKSSNPNTGLHRHEFLEALVRLSLHKFQRTGVFPDPHKAVNRYIEDLNLKEDAWRNDYHSEDVSEFLESKQVMFDFVFKTISKSS